MENKLLSQSDIDSMVSNLGVDDAPAANAPAPQPAQSPAQVAPPGADQPQQPQGQPPESSPTGTPTQFKLKKASMRHPEEVADSGADSEAIATLTAQNNKLQEKLTKLESKVQKLEQLEKVRSGVIKPISPQQVLELEKQVEQLTDIVQGMSFKLQGTLGYDIYHLFTCEKCGTQEQVSTVYKCTRCGHESWLGWRAQQ